MDKEQSNIIGLLCERLPKVVAIYSFGSSGTPYERKDSDVDLAVLPQDPVDSAYLWEVAQEVAKEVGKNVDLVDLLQASTVMRSQVLVAAKRLYCRDRLACESFEDYVYASYARLNEERRDILADIKQRGTVYG
jgi:predicted nucleotidyltransferase